MGQLIQAVVSSTNFGPCYPERQTRHSILIHGSTSRPPFYASIRTYSMFDSKKFLNLISSGVSFDRLAGFGVSVTRCIKVHQRHSQAPQGTYVLCVWRINVFINVSSILRTCILFDYFYIEALVVRDKQKLSSPSSAVTSKDWGIFTEVRLDPDLICLFSFGSQIMRASLLRLYLVCLCRVSMLSFTYGVCLKLRCHSDTRFKCPWGTFKLSKRCTKSIKCVGRCCLRLLMTSPCLVVVLWFERSIDLLQTINIQVVACHPLDINRQVIYNRLEVVRFQKHFEHACYFQCDTTFCYFPEASFSVSSADTWNYLCRSLR